MTTAYIQQEVFALLKTYAGRSANPTPVTLATRLSEDLDIDSARLVDIILDLEAKFEITIDDAVVPKLHTVSDLVELVDSLARVTKTA
jgi:acyl carrier protein